MRIGLLGHGVVGQGVRKIIDAHQTSATAAMSVVRILVRDQSEITDERITTDPEEFFTTDMDVVVECMGGVDKPFEFVSRALSAGMGVVSSNKKLLAHKYDELQALATQRQVPLAFEAAIGGGIPWLHNLALTAQVDEVESFRGIFNGTTNYILDEMFTHGQNFDDALRGAQERGYAEADPSDDIDGHDVKYKTVLTANRIWGVSVPLEQVPALGLRHVDGRDAKWAAAHGKTIKLLGMARATNQGVMAGAMPVMLPANHLLAGIHQNFNCAMVNSNNFGEAAYYGQGAGMLPTAFAVVSDLVSVQALMVQDSFALAAPGRTVVAPMWQEAWGQNASPLSREVASVDQLVSSPAQSLEVAPMDQSALQGKYYLRPENSEDFDLLWDLVEFTRPEKLENGAILTGGVHLPLLMNSLRRAGFTTGVVGDISTLVCEVEDSSAKMVADRGLFLALVDSGLNE
ncbi:hypothetical protein BK816_00665 [Boudabousia tangfeifanii]|uniref:Homoserine dehydrogenase n=1 Tax=Boudabousia tangfeifanii TaxID=1912795 RepID=A0A1D9MIF2_9ACTO|nr:homoserine dehydrogenase [Boudabousia tangfeifanii]AOZ71988.1 hypothetical protein BK816_00665 [Boudabousia tangfeifanii]